MHVQYVGFVVADRFRTYSFQVVVPSEETRDFVVKVPSELFRPLLLKFQDGPSLAFAMLKRELDGETPELHAQSQLDVAENDAREYLDRQPRASKRNNHRTSPLATPGVCVNCDNCKAHGHCDLHALWPDYLFARLAC